MLQRMSYLCLSSFALRQGFERKPCTQTLSTPQFAIWAVSICINLAEISNWRAPSDLVSVSITAVCHVQRKVKKTSADSSSMGKAQDMHSPTNIFACLNWLQITAVKSKIQLVSVTCRCCSGNFHRLNALCCKKRLFWLFARMRERRRVAWLSGLLPGHSKISECRSMLKGQFYKAENL